MIIDIEDISFAYQSDAVLDDITLHIERGVLTSIIGPNGVGKSTLLYCMNRLIEPQSGTVLIDGKEIGDYKLKDLAKEVGFVPYSSKDGFPLAVIDTVVMGCHPYSKVGSYKNDIRAAHSILEMLGIEHLAFRPFSELSAGQRQKVMLARGIVQKPKILLLDEPTANLDVRHQMEVTRILEELSRNEDMAVVMVSHDLNIASKYSNQMIMMHDGRIFSAGAPSEVITTNNLRIVYGVDADVINHRSRPYVLLNGPLEDADDDRVFRLRQRVLQIPSQKDFVHRFLHIPDLHRLWSLMSGRWQTHRLHGCVSYNMGSLERCLIRIRYAGILG